MSKQQLLTISEICADLKVTEAEWNQWRADGLTPLHVVGPDGEPRVGADQYREWFKSLRLEDVDPDDIDAYERGAFNAPDMLAPGALSLVPDHDDPEAEP